MNAHPTQAAGATQHASSEKRRRTLLTLAMIGALVVGGGYALYWSHVTQQEETTEDAYVEGNIVQVTSQVAGTVVAIGADNTDRVSAGQSLVRLNPLDAQLALERSEAMLAKTVRQVRSQYAVASQMRAIVELRRSELRKVQADMDRRSGLLHSGAVSGEDLEHASEAVSTASAALKSAEQQYAANQAYVDGTTVATHPDVLSVSAQVKDAYIGAARAVVPAPVGGIVARRNVQVGQRVAAGVSMMSIIPLESLWVTANFKESQLRYIHTGQPVIMTADAYGRQVKYRGKVIGQEAGTGSAFSLMPAQNATGNWIKVVQRLPVRIALDPNEVRKNPLQLGLSMRVSIDTSKRDGTPFALAGNPAHAYETEVFAQEGKDAAALVTRIIAMNMAGSSVASAN
ncbi:HlyD family secretion protein [Janthinobacterium sp. HLX7-2]|uniref:HlyD family secretion protein n=1 Tax=Janthinobacterium sp. HLX7-2 TaxID=1259331 RepID=UPI003F296A9C